MKKLLIIGALLLSSCGSLQFKYGALNQAAHNQALNGNPSITVKTYTTTFQTFKNLDPQDLGLSHGGSWIHCRTHGFHDLNDWTDFSYSPRWCRPSEGFTRAASWNTNWAWMHQNGWNNWNWNPRHRFNYWGNNWSPWMGNVHYGYGNNYYGWGQQNTWYWSNGYYGGNYMYGRRPNMNGRRGSLLGAYSRTTTRNGRAHSSMIESTKRTTKPRRVIRTNTTPINNNTTKPRRVIREKPVVPVIRNNNTKPVIRNNNTRPVIRNNSRNNNIRPTSTRPIRNNTTRTNNNRTTSTNKRTTKKN